MCSLVLASPLPARAKAAATKPSAPKDQGVGKGAWVADKTRAERHSNDSVISFLDGACVQPPAEPTSPASVLEAVGPARGVPGWSLDQKKPLSQAPIGKGRAALVGGVSYSDMVKGSALKNEACRPWTDTATPSGRACAPEAMESAAILWFEGVAYVKSSDESGYSSS